MAAKTAGDSKEPELAVVAGRPVPLFAARDIAGRPYSLRQYRGRPATLFIFCGCEACHACARLWGQLQRTHSLPKAPLAPGNRDGVDPKISRADDPTPVTLVLYLDGRGALRTFAEQVDLDARQTILLPDPEMKTTALLDRGVHCPRVVVMDRRGIARYVNSHPDDEPQVGSAATIVSRAVEALRDCGQVPRAPSTSRKVAGGGHR